MDVTINQDQLTIMLLYSLPYSFENFRCAIETRDTLPTAEDLKIKIIEESDARNSKQQEHLEAMLANSAKGGHFRKCDKKGSKQGTGINKQTENHFPYKCHKCRKIGHKAADCRSKSSKSFEKTANIEEMGFLTTVFEKSALKTESDLPENKWCLDSGCTSHMCNNQEKFISNEKCDNDKLCLASNATTQIKSKGTVNILINNHDQTKSVKLYNTLYVPELRTHLMSVGKIYDNGYTVTFKSDSAVIHDASGNEKLSAKRVDGLYYVKEVSESVHLVSESDHPNKLELWHRRLGPLNEADVKRVLKTQGIKYQQNKTFEICEICVLGKFTQKSSPKNRLGKQNHWN